MHPRTSVADGHQRAGVDQDHRSGKCALRISSDRSARSGWPLSKLPMNSGSPSGVAPASSPRPPPPPVAKPRPTVCASRKEPETAAVRTRSRWPGKRHDAAARPAARCRRRERRPPIPRRRLGRSCFERTAGPVLSHPRYIARAALTGFVGERGVRPGRARLGFDELASRGAMLSAFEHFFGRPDRSTDALSMRLYRSAGGPLS